MADGPMTMPPTQRRRVPPVHPLLLASYPILFLYGQNLGEVRFGELLAPIALSLAAATTVYGLFSAVLRDVRRGALLASIALVAVFGFGRVRDLLDGTAFGGGRLLLAWGMLTVLAMVLAVRVRRGPIRLTSGLNVVAAILVITAAAPIAVHELGAIGAGGAGAGGPTPRPVVAGSSSGPARDIYYIMVEDLGSERTLREDYGLKETGLFDWLREDGFVVPTDAKTNYNKTVQVLAAAFNMTYLDEIAARVGTQSGDSHPLYEMIDDNVVARFLKSQGYRYHHIGAWWDPTERSSIADRNYGLQQRSDFAATLYRTTILPDVVARLPRLGIRLPIEADATGDEGQYASALYGFRALEEASAAPGPKFVFAHFLIPHDPFVFAADGSRLTPELRRGRSANELFLEQARYTNTRVRAIVETLLAGPEATRPIIVVQTDEGPNPARYERDPTSFAWTDATLGELRVKFEILNAFYLPGVEVPAIPPTMSPVNTFRLIFSLYFGADLPLLPDRQVIFRDKAHPYDFTDVTDRLASP